MEQPLGFVAQEKSESLKIEEVTLRSEIV